MHRYLVVSMTRRGQYRTAGFATREAAETYAGYRRGMPAIEDVVVIDTTCAIA